MKGQKRVSDHLCLIKDSVKKKTTTNCTPDTPKVINGLGYNAVLFESRLFLKKTRKSYSLIAIYFHYSKQTIF